MDFQRSPKSVKSEESLSTSNETFQKYFNNNCEKNRKDSKINSNEIKCSENTNFLITNSAFQKLNSDIESIHSEVEQICKADQSKLYFYDVRAKADDSESNKTTTSPEKELISEKTVNDNFEKSNGISYFSDKKSSVEDAESCDIPCVQDSRRTRRNSKRKRDEEVCPLCGVTVRVPELENHYAKEVQNLAKLPTKTLRKPRIHDHSEGISTTFVQVKSNRENRLSAKVERYAARDRNVIRCPVCNIKILGNEEEKNRHVLNCIREEESHDELVVVDFENVEEYEIGDQTRVRAIDFVPGGYRSLEGSSSKPKTTEDEDVDVDDTISFGKPQYTEMDVIHSTADESEVKEIEKLRKAVLLDPNVQPHIIKDRKWSDEKEEENVSDSNKKDQSSHVVSTLKDKIKDLEEQNRSVKCLICLEPYTKPVVSTTCWHVHCEECWLMTMGVKKLCPQCNMIVFPSDLRRIYL